ncbi:glycoside hydrolase [Amylocarpus encephaloides]|uniref:Glucanase n=1 Tax=Amylocarpus encephaloides TaxID=45428 RepID=A0A9P7YPJ0_9HELO|nr:glycoside hydrolase [Amylocarpus encephaloides]
MEYLWWHNAIYTRWSLPVASWKFVHFPNHVHFASNCALDGGSYASTYGFTTSGNALRPNFVTRASQKNIDSRLCHMAGDDKYQTFNKFNQEFTFDVDTSKLPCGLNGGLDMVRMDSDSELSSFPNNKACAKYSIGYCDAQANVEGLIPSSNDVST